MERLFADTLGRYDCLFVGPHGDDVLLACPARVLNEVERGSYPKPRVDYVPVPCLHCEEAPCIEAATAAHPTTQSNQWLSGLWAGNANWKSHPREVSMRAPQGLACISTDPGKDSV